MTFFSSLAHLINAGTHERITFTLCKAGGEGQVRVAFFPVLAESKDKSLTDDEKSALTSSLTLEGTIEELEQSWALIVEHSNVLVDASTQIEEAKAKVKKATTKKAPAKKAPARKTAAQKKEEARAKQAAEAPKEKFTDERSKVDNEEKAELDKAADAVQATSPEPQNEMDDLLAGL